MDSLAKIVEHPRAEAARNALKKSMREKLSPAKMRDRGFSPRMVGVVSFLIGEKGFTTPEILEMNQTSDGYIIAKAEGISRDVFIGEAKQYFRNIRLVASEFQLNEAERALLIKTAERIG